MTSRPYLVASAAVAGATTLGVLVGMSMPDETMLYLFAIMVAALGGRGPGGFAAALSVLSYDFFFVPPRFTLAVADVHDLMTFAVMFTVGIAIGTLVARLRTAREVELRARAEELRSSLLSAVSHDLRTPLAAITGMATQLRDSAQATSGREALRPEGASRQWTRGERAALDTIVDEASRLGTILTNVLAITRVERAEIRGDWVPVEELVGAALARAETVLTGRDVALTIPPDIGVTVDPVLIEQLLWNLLDNAAKHTPAGSPIAVRARKDGAGATIEICDRGPGLPQGRGEIEQLFAKFVRGPGVRATGAGLGLAVCRGIAIAHGGSITADERAGGGAIFRVWLPGGDAPSPALEPEVVGA